MKKQINELDIPKKSDLEIMEEIHHQMIMNIKELKTANKILKQEVEEKERNENLRNR